MIVTSLRCAECAHETSEIPDRYEHLVRFRRLVLEPGALVERAKALKGQDMPTTPAAAVAPVSAI